MGKTHSKKTTKVYTEPIKIVVVGPSGSGKTTLLMGIETIHQNQEFKVFNEGEWGHNHYIPCVYDAYEIPVHMRGETIRASFWDTIGSQDHSRLRPLAYIQADVFLLCYGVDKEEKDQFNEIKDDFIPEIRRFCKKEPIYLVGLKNDLPPDKRVITRDSAQQFYEENRKKLICHREVSIKTGEGIEELIEEATEVGMTGEPPTIVIGKAVKRAI